MFCVRCGKKNPDVARFCFACGVALEVAPKTAPSVQSGFDHSRSVAMAQAPDVPVQGAETQSDRSPSSKTCPRCGLFNELTSAACDCGYSFVPSAVQDRKLAQSGRPQADALAPLQPRAQLAIVFLVIGAVVAAAAVVSTLFQINLLEQIAGGAELSDGEIASNDTRQGAMGVVQLGVLISTVVLFCRWMYRAHSNLLGLSTVPLLYTPGGAVGSFFIPFVNLVRPYRAMTELWHRSAGQAFRSVAEMPSVNLIKNWWGSYLLMGFLGNAATRFMARAKTPGEYVASSWILVLSDGVAILAVLPAILVIKRITDMQERARQGATPLSARE